MFGHHWCRQLISLALVGQLLFPTAIFAQEVEQIEPIVAEVSPEPEPEPEPEAIMAPFSVQTPQTTLSAWIEYPRMCTGVGRQRDLKSGDELVIYAETNNSSIPVGDLSAIGIADSVTFAQTENPNLFISKSIVPPNIQDGTVELLINSGEAANTIELSIDNQPPVLAVEWSQSNHGRVVQYIDGYIYGSLSDNLLEPVLFEGRRIGYDEHAVRIDSPYVWSGLPSGLSGHRSGDFSEISVGIGEFDPGAKMVAIELTAADWACNITRATTTPITYYPHGADVPPIPVPSSSVLFLPGIKGSRLFAGDGEELWLPGINDEDIHELYLDSLGRSARDDVYVQEGIDGALLSVPGTDIYASFAASMDALVAQGEIAEWKPLAYDWRLSLYDLTTKGVARDGKVFFNEEMETPYLEAELRALASRSPTGKVSIVAHSNGGLVTKALIKHLGEESSSLVDKVILVGVPQAGAPQALGALLFGYREALPARKLPLMVSEPDARTFAHNAPMGYHLLPSAYYLEHQAGDENLISFVGEETYASEIAAYGNTIDAWWELRNLILANEGGRVKPSQNDLKNPDIGNEHLLNYAEDVHTYLAGWQPSQPIETYTLVGTGAETIVGIEFDEFRFPGFEPKRVYRPVFSRNGDEVVPDASATSEAGNIWVDLKYINRIHAGEINHGTLLDSDDINSIVSYLLTGKEVVFPAGISYTPPETIKEQRLLFFLHSPATILIRDSSGNLLGVNERGEEQDEIPESSYGTFGEVKYASIPATGEYEVQLTGTGSGEYTFEIYNSDVEQRATYANIPVTLDHRAYLEIQNGRMSQGLQVDSNNDLVVDYEVRGEYGRIEYFSTTNESVTSNGFSADSSNDSQSTATSSTTVTTPYDLALVSQTDSDDITRAVTETSVSFVLGTSTTEAQGHDIPESYHDSAQEPWYLKLFQAVYLWISNIIKFIGGIIWS